MFLHGGPETKEYEVNFGAPNNYFSKLLPLKWFLWCAKPSFLVLFSVDTQK